MPIVIKDRELDPGLDRMSKAQPIPVPRISLVRSILRSAIDEFEQTGDAQAWRNKSSASKSAPPKAQHSKQVASPSIPGNTPTSSGHSATPVKAPAAASGSASSATPSSAPARANGAATTTKPARAAKPAPKPSKAQPAGRRAGANLGSFVAKPA